MFCYLKTFQSLNLFWSAQLRFLHDVRKQLFAAACSALGVVSCNVTSHVPSMTVSLCLRYNKLQDDLSYSYPHRICSYDNSAAATSLCQRNEILALPVLSVSFCCVCIARDLRISGACSWPYSCTKHSNNRQPESPRLPLKEAANDLCVITERGIEIVL